jgi:hypothetical protein
VKIAACVLTYQAISTGRLEDLKRTLRSLQTASEVFVYDNGSTDGTQDLVESWGGVVNTTSLHTSGHGTNMCARILASTDADICVLSDDDMTWNIDYWDVLLSNWWMEAPGDIWLTGGHLEPAYPWNEIRGQVEYGGVKGLIRTSTGAASWTYRREMTDQIFPIPQQVQGWGDVPACDRIDERGGKVAQIDLAEHAGHGRSTWGNKTAAKYGHDLGPVRAMVSA